MKISLETITHIVDDFSKRLKLCIDANAGYFEWIVMFVVVILFKIVFNEVINPRSINPFEKQHFKSVTCIWAHLVGELETKERKTEYESKKNGTRAYACSFLTLYDRQLFVNFCFLLLRTFP